MQTIGSFEAKTNLARLLKRVAKGERFTITQRGVPVARLLPLESNEEQPPLEDTIAAIRRFREAHPLGDLTIRELIDYGRRS